MVVGIPAASSERRRATQVPRRNATKSGDIGACTVTLRGRPASAAPPRLKLAQRPSGLGRLGLPASPWCANGVLIVDQARGFGHRGSFFHIHAVLLFRPQADFRSASIRSTTLVAAGRSFGVIGLPARCWVDERCLVVVLERLGHEVPRRLAHDVLGESKHILGFFGERARAGFRPCAGGRLLAPAARRRPDHRWGRFRQAVHYGRVDCLSLRQTADSELAGMTRRTRSAAAQTTAKPTVTGSVLPLKS